MNGKICCCFSSPITWCWIGCMIPIKQCETIRIVCPILELDCSSIILSKTKYKVWSDRSRSRTKYCARILKRIKHRHKKGPDKGKHNLLASLSILSRSCPPKLFYNRRIRICDEGYWFFLISQTYSHRYLYCCIYGVLRNFYETCLIRWSILWLL